MTIGVVDEVAEFEQQRPRLFGIAYRMLGEASEAEDVVQDAYLRWRSGHGPVQTPPRARPPRRRAATLRGATRGRDGASSRPPSTATSRAWRRS
ncbi:MAG TPA: sigma factor [Kribbella sp.]